MQNILVPVDGSDVSLRAVRFIADRITHGYPATLYLLNVQPPILTGDVKMFVSGDVIAEYYRQEGESALTRAKALLDEAGVPYDAYVQIGHIAETIARFAADKQCSSIVMGARGLGSVVGMLLGSVTTKVLYLVSIPVTIVK
ncbi:universal stress protein [Uliginosibacterium sp. sgz301328]|uniref:universal stress protein n=1 Tax=Uliginosibacterium sp. sgz301328 TaxID=3243764 RepID=UPI00359D2372